MEELHLHSALCRRSPRGERGLKYQIDHALVHWLKGRSPRGERGLKFVVDMLTPHIGWLSLPSRGAWIEIIVYIVSKIIRIEVAPLAGSVD